MEPTMHFRWLISPRNDADRVLQQKWVNEFGLEIWEDVEEVVGMLPPSDGTPPAPV